MGDLVYIGMSARRAKVNRPWRRSGVRPHAVDGQLAFERSPFKYDFGNLEWALKKNWTTLSVVREGLIKAIIPGLLSDYAVYLRGDGAGLPTEIEQQRQMSDIGENIDRQNLGQIDDRFDE
jgi:hypothetical protein